MNKTVARGIAIGSMSLALVIMIAILVGAIPLLETPAAKGESSPTTLQEKSSEYPLQGQAKVKRTTLSTYVTAPGEVKARATEKLKLDTYRPYKSLLVPLNTRITKGTPLLSYTYGNDLTAPYDLVLTATELPAKAKEIPTNEHFLQVSRVDSMNVDIAVNETELSKVHADQSAQVKVGAYPDEVLDGIVTAINQVGSYQSSGSRYTVTITVPNTDERLLIGMSAQVSIKTSEAVDVLAVPVSAVYRHGESTVIRLVKANGEIEERAVTCGVSDGTLVEITGDIEEGDLVQTSETYTVKHQSENTSGEQGETGLSGVSS